MCRIEALPRKQRIESKYFVSIEEEGKTGGVGARFEQSSSHKAYNRFEDLIFFLYLFKWQVLIALVLKLYVSFMGSGSFNTNEALWCRNPT